MKGREPITNDAIAHDLRVLYQAWCDRYYGGSIAKKDLVKILRRLADWIEKGVPVSESRNTQKEISDERTKIQSLG